MASPLEVTMRAAAAVVGYAMVVVRLGHLAATATGRERWLARLGLFVTFFGLIVVVGLGRTLIIGSPTGRQYRLRACQAAAPVLVCSRSSASRTPSAPGLMPIGEMWLQAIFPSRSMT